MIPNSFWEKIRENESSQNPNAYNRGTDKEGNVVGYTPDSSSTALGPLTDLTFGELRRRQALPIENPDRIFAAGSYQIIPSTLNQVFKNSGLTDEDTFSEENQLRLASEIVRKKRPEVYGYLTGEHDDLNKAGLHLAKEWASFSKPGKGDDYSESYYGNKGNKAHVSWKDSQAMLRKARDEMLTGNPVLPDFPNPMVAHSSLALGDKERKTKIDPILSRDPEGYSGKYQPSNFELAVEEVDQLIRNNPDDWKEIAFGGGSFSRAAKAVDDLIKSNPDDWEKIAFGADNSWMKLEAEGFGQSNNLPADIQNDFYGGQNTEEALDAAVKTLFGLGSDALHVGDFDPREYKGDETLTPEENWNRILKNGIVYAPPSGNKEQGYAAYGMEVPGDPTRMRMFGITEELAPPGATFGVPWGEEQSKHLDDQYYKYLDEEGLSPLEATARLAKHWVMNTANTLAKGGTSTAMALMAGVMGWVDTDLTEEQKEGVLAGERGSFGPWDPLGKLADERIDKAEALLDGIENPTQEQIAKAIETANEKIEKLTEKEHRSYLGLVAKMAKSLNIPQSKVPELLQAKMEANLPLWDRKKIGALRRAELAQREDTWTKPFFLTKTGPVSERPPLNSDGSRPWYIETTPGNVALDAGIALSLHGAALALRWAMPTLIWGKLTTGKSVQAARLFGQKEAQRRELELLIKQFDDVIQVEKASSIAGRVFAKLGVGVKKNPVGLAREKYVNSLTGWSLVSGGYKLKRLKQLLKEIEIDNAALKKMGILKIPSTAKFAKLAGKNKVEKALPWGAPLWMRVTDELTISMAAQAAATNFVLTGDAPFIKRSTEEESRNASMGNKFLTAMLPVFAGIGVFNFFPGRWMGKSKLNFSLDASRLRVLAQQTGEAGLNDGSIRPILNEQGGFTLDTQKGVAFAKEGNSEENGLFDHFNIPNAPWGPDTLAHYQSQWENLRALATDPEGAEKLLEKIIALTKESYGKGKNEATEIDAMIEMARQNIIGGGKTPGFVETLANLRARKAWNVDEYLAEGLTREDIAYIRSMHEARYKEYLPENSSGRIVETPNGPAINLDEYNIEHSTRTGAVASRLLTDGSTEFLYYKNPGKLNAETLLNIKASRLISEALKRNKNSALDVGTSSWLKQNFRAARLGELDNLAKSIIKLVAEERAFRGVPRPDKNTPDVKFQNARSLADREIEREFKVFDELSSLDYSELEKRIKESSFSTDQVIQEARKLVNEQKTSAMNYAEEGIAISDARVSGDALFEAYINQRIALEKWGFVKGNKSFGPEDYRRRLEQSLKDLARKSLPEPPLNEWINIGSQVVPAGKFISPGNLIVKLGSLLKSHRRLGKSSKPKPRKLEQTPNPGGATGLVELARLNKRVEGQHVLADSDQAQSILRAAKERQEIAIPLEDLPPVLYGVDIPLRRDAFYPRHLRGKKLAGSGVWEDSSSTAGGKNVTLFTSKEAAAAFYFDVQHALKIASAKNPANAKVEFEKAIEFDLVNLNVDAQKFITNLDRIMQEVSRHGDSYDYYENVWLAYRRQDLGGSSLTAPLPSKKYLTGQIDVRGEGNSVTIKPFSTHTMDIPERTFVLGSELSGPHPNRVLIYSDLGAFEDIILAPKFFDMSLSNAPISRRGNLRLADIAAEAGVEGRKSLEGFMQEEIADLALKLEKVQENHPGGNWIGSINAANLPVNMGVPLKLQKKGKGTARKSRSFIPERHRPLVDRDFTPAEYKTNGFAIAQAIAAQLGGRLNPNIAEISNTSVKAMLSALEVGRIVAGEDNWKMPGGAASRGDGKWDKAGKYLKPRTIRNQVFKYIPGTKEGMRNAPAAQMEQLIRRSWGQEGILAQRFGGFRPEGDLSPRLLKEYFAMATRTQELFQKEGIDAMRTLFAGLGEYGEKTASEFYRGTPEQGYLDGLNDILEKMWQGDDPDAYKRWKELPEELPYGPNLEDVISKKDLLTAIDIADEAIVSPRRGIIERFDPKVSKMWHDRYIPRSWNVVRGEEYRRWLQEQDPELGLQLDEAALKQLDIDDQDLARGNQLLKSPGTLIQLHQDQKFLGQQYGEAVASGNKSFAGRRRHLASKLKGDPGDFDYYSEMMKRGFIPVTDNPIEMMEIKASQMDRFIQQQRILRNIEDEGLIFKLSEHQKGVISRRHMMARSSNNFDPFQDQLLLDVTPYINKISADALTESEIDSGIKIYADNAVATVLNRLTSSGIYGRTTSSDKAWSMHRRSNNLFNGINLGWSWFHASAVGMFGQTSDDFGRLVEMRVNKKFYGKNSLNMSGRKISKKSITRKTLGRVVIPGTSTLLQAGKFPVETSFFGLHSRFLGLAGPGESPLARKYSLMGANKKYLGFLPPEYFTYVDPQGKLRGRGFASFADMAAQDLKVLKYWRKIANTLKRVTGKELVDPEAPASFFTDLMPPLLRDTAAQQGSFGETMEQLVSGLTPMRDANPIAAKIIQAGIDVNFLQTDSLAAGARNFQFTFRRSIEDASAYWKNKLPLDQYPDMTPPGVRKRAGMLLSMPVRHLAKWAENLSEWMFEGLIPRLKRSSYTELMVQEQIKNPNMSNSQLLKKAQIVAESVDNRMGMMNYQNLLMDGLAKDFMFFYWRAPGWKLGTKREILGGIADVGRLAGLKATRGLEQLGGIAEESRTKQFAGVEGFSLRSSFVAGLIATGMYTYLYFGMMTGKFPRIQWDDDLSIPDNLSEFMRVTMFPPTGNMVMGPFGITEEKWNTPTYLKYLFQWWSDPWSLFYGLGEALPPATNTLIAIIGNKTWDQEQIYDAEGSYFSQAYDVIGHVIDSNIAYSIDQLGESIHEDKGAGAIAAEFFLGLTSTGSKYTSTQGEKALLAFRLKGLKNSDAKSPLTGKERKLKQDLMRESFKLGQLSNAEIKESIETAWARGKNPGVPADPYILKLTQQIRNKYRNTLYTRDGFKEGAEMALHKVGSYADITRVINRLNDTEYRIIFPLPDYREYIQGFIQSSQTTGWGIPARKYLAGDDADPLNSLKVDDINTLTDLMQERHGKTRKLAGVINGDIETLTEEVLYKAGVSGPWISKILWERNQHEKLEGKKRGLNGR